MEELMEREQGHQGFPKSHHQRLTLLPRLIRLCSVLHQINLNKKLWSIF